jgi:hypothetical protein
VEQDQVVVEGLDITDPELRDLLRAQAAIGGQERAEVTGR